jgi:hypothetical protein
MEPSPPHLDGGVIAVPLSGEKEQRWESQNQDCDASRCGAIRRPPQPSVKGKRVDCMTEKLSENDYDLLRDLNARGGRARISDGRPRQGAERLVSSGYATSCALNMSDVEYEITQSGRAALVLKDYGIYSTRLMIEPHRSEIDGLWRLKISSKGNPAVLMGIGAATKLVPSLREVGDLELADLFENEIDRARRYTL